MLLKIVVLESAEAAKLHIELMEQFCEKGRETPRMDKTCRCFGPLIP